jgi:vibriolysin
LLQFKLAVEGESFGSAPDRGGASRPVVYLDLETGEVLDQYESLTTARVVEGIGGNVKVGQKEYKKDAPLPLTLTENEGRCYYQTDSVVVYKITGEGASDKIPYSVPCDEQENEKVNGAFAPINDAIYNVDAFISFIKQRYGVAPLGEDRVTVEVQAADEDNAAWTGKVLLLNNGAKAFHPLTSADVTAHELGHAIVEYNSKLEYRDQSGGLNEAFADIAGKTADTYIKGLGEPESWAVGEAILKSDDKALRYMSDPSKDGKSIDNMSAYTKGFDVHYSSGIINKAFYNLVNKPSFSIWEAHDMFYFANMFYWRSTTGFEAGAEGALRALCEMREGKIIDYDYSHLKPEEAMEAFKDVGLDCADMGQSCKHQCTIA